MPDEPSEIVEEDLGGVQGADDRPDAPIRIDGDGPTDVLAPDAGEIEWAGGLVKKAPGSHAD